LLSLSIAGTVFTTAGIHPCSSQIFSAKFEGNGELSSHACDPDPSKPIPEDEDPCLVKTDEIMTRLSSLFEETRSFESSGQRQLVAFGELGLDYDRLHYCSKKMQLHSFAIQLKLAASMDPQLPLFLHSRAAHEDVVRHLKTAFGERLERFTGTVEEMKELVDLGLYIGVNGCSLKTEANCAVVREIPLDRIMLETDGPWCEIRPSHEAAKYLAQVQAGQEVDNVSPSSSKPGKGKPGKPATAPQGRFKVVKKEKWVEGAMIKGRNEPCTIETVAKAVAAIKNIPVEILSEAAWENTCRLYGFY
jgi:TatD DNase family protein